ncbi:MAG: TIGR00282 family metallophosphoesterase [Spirochaetaceae bacterium]|nr:TIGR00282 family metallophosphoesterase [Spirochaetaceae bacterium]
MSGSLKVFMGGDVFSDAGIAVVEKKLKDLRQKYSIDFVIYNGENASGGNGLLEYDAKKLFEAGVDVITGGNHIFEKRDNYSFLASEKRVLRPHNYPRNLGSVMENAEEIPGHGFGFYECKGQKIAVLNLQGRESMTALDCPFKAAAECAKEAAEAGALLFVDFHAESNDEKEALALFLDGKAAAVCGTHTHVQTADERILPKGTAYITDLGMSGVADSVIGSDAEIVVKRNLTQVLYKMENAAGEAVIQGALISIEDKTVTKIERIQF